jgi:hypothetical protein
LVHINHLRNCLLCHAPSFSQDDPIAGLVPIPGEPLPDFYSDERTANHLLVRADVVYLRQDFSLLLDVDHAAPWPTQQRFDFLVRTRELTHEEARAHCESDQQSQRNPQREAVRFALGELTGKDRSDTDSGP